MRVQTNVQISIDAPIEQVFDCSIDCQNLPKFFTGYRGIPAIVSAITTDGLPLHEGSTRIVQNSDGSEIEEAIVSLQRPTLQAYKLLNGFKPPFSWLVRSASGQWLYQPHSTGTQITWQFEFEMQNAIAYIVFLALIKHPFQTSQSICLINLKQTIEHSNWRNHDDSPHFNPSK
ncbi:SRPBCC family protein [Leptolyngbya sp. PL-A3]|uniref:SRPBCC family protein n=1 Tax=Leptolyngbya sp. PL-A3 TaxID=2933911 RepID=UPI0032976001